jgi:uncharacterized protein
MAETTSYSEGVPCWVDAAVTDVESAKQFYSALFGWDYLDAGPDSGGYWLATLRGKQVAGIGPTQGPEDRSAWTIYLWTDDAAAAAKLIADAGGSVLAEPMDVSDHGRMSIAADPSGAVFGLWQGTSHRGAGLANEHGAFTWNELPTPDTAAAREFYTAVFGYSYHPVEGAMDYQVFQVGGRGVGGIMGQLEGRPELPPHWSVYFEVDATDTAVARVRDNGGQVGVAAQDTPFGRMAVVQDCCGTFTLIHGQTGDQAAAQ